MAEADFTRGERSNVFLLTTAARAPVRQIRRPGRLPKSITSLIAVRQEKEREQCLDMGRAVTPLVLTMRDNGGTPENIITGLIGNAVAYAGGTGSKKFAVSLLREALERLEGTGPTVGQHQVSPGTLRYLQLQEAARIMASLPDSALSNALAELQDLVGNN